MSVLTVIQDLTDTLGLKAPTTIIGNADRTVKQFLALAHETGEELVSKVDWPELIRSHTITLAGSTTGYALPTDYDRQIPRTHWDQSNDWEIIGPISQQELQWRTEGVGGTNTTKRRFYVEGITSTQFQVYPTPVAAEAGETLVFKYMTKSYVKPVLWAASTTYAASDVVRNTDGELLSADAGGTSGASEPDSGNSYNDGTLQWTVVSTFNNRFLDDTDSVWFDEELFKLGIRWRFMLAKGLQYQVYFQQYEEMLSREHSATRGSRTLDLTGRAAPTLIGPENIPDTGFG
jgi:hypothetical protein